MGRGCHAALLGDPSCSTIDWMTKGRNSPCATPYTQPQRLPRNTWNHDTDKTARDREGELRQQHRLERNSGESSFFHCFSIRGTWTSYGTGTTSCQIWCSQNRLGVAKVIHYIQEANIILHGFMIPLVSIHRIE